MTTDLSRSQGRSAARYLSAGYLLQAQMLHFAGLISSPLAGLDYGYGIYHSAVAVVGKPALGGVEQALAAGGADAVASPLAFVVGGHVADARVQPNGVVLEAGPVEFGPQPAGSVIESRCCAPGSVETLG